MKISIKKGFSFGLTSGVITTLGLIIGLHSSTSSDIVIISGILVIAIADAMSDALGIHMSEEVDNKNTTKEVWESTIATFLSKFVFALMFVIPILFLELSTAIIFCVVWGLFLIIIFSYYLAKKQKINPYPVVLEHLLITIIVIILTHYIGVWLATLS
ncbi:MAG: VIT1/CCC1 transporter family protein [Patescibacteria group bacterium]|jgi:VIT1/CCC1 family predicted Fe2+/Mn2+ transporter